MSGTVCSDMAGTPAGCLHGSGPFGTNRRGLADRARLHDMDPEAALRQAAEARVAELEARIAGKRG